MKTKNKKTVLNHDNLKRKHSTHPVDHAIDQLTIAQAIMFDELEGKNPYGMYSEFDSLIKLLNMYKNSELKVGI